MGWLTREVFLVTSKFRYEIEPIWCRMVDLCGKIMIFSADHHSFWSYGQVNRAKITDFWLSPNHSMKSELNGIRVLIKNDQLIEYYNFSTKYLQNLKIRKNRNLLETTGEKSSKKCRFWWFFGHNSKMNGGQQKRTPFFRINRPFCIRYTRSYIEILTSPEISYFPSDDTYLVDLAELLKSNSILFSLTWIGFPSLFIVLF
jgi:hypothetical protein